MESQQAQQPEITQQAMQEPAQLQHFEQPQQPIILRPDESGSSFGNSDSFNHAQRVAKMLCQSKLIPADYQNNIPNTMIALEMANRIGASPLMVMQNLYIVHGKPGWSSTFIIAAINASRKFSPLRFDISGEGDEYGCTAWARELSTGDRLEGSRITIAMAKAEGWSTKAGSKWKTMPDQMLRYRAATFFGRLYAPEILMGMQTQDELHDVVQQQETNEAARIVRSEAAAASFKPEN